MVQSPQLTEWAGTAFFHPSIDQEAKRTFPDVFAHICKNIGKCAFLEGEADLYVDYFERVCGYESEKEELREIAGYLSDPGPYLEVGARMPAGLLITGEPGLGKTLMAECLIEASHLPSFICRKTKRGNELLDTIRKTFESAVDEAPAIVLLDDIDKFSNCDYELCDTEEYVTLQACIDDCRDKGVFVIGTANDEAKLPRSLLRAGRFDRVICLEPPLGADAHAITAHYLEDIPLAKDARISAMVGIAEGHSCAFIEGLINEASLMAGFERADAVSLLHFVKAYARLKGNGVLAMPSPSEPDEMATAWASERAQIAFHEAGHVIIEELLDPGSVSLALITRSQGKLSGLTKSRHINPAATVERRKSELLISLAGRVAVERKYGVPAFGCTSDNDHASEITRNLLRDAALLGAYFTTPHRWSGSESIADASEHASSSIITMATWEVRELLARNWDAVEIVAEHLYSKGYTMPEDIEKALSTGGDYPCHTPMRGFPAEHETRELR